MRTKRYWENRYNDFCDKILGNAIYYCQLDLDEVKNEITRTERFYKENMENNEYSSEEIIMYCYINHELNLLDPIGCCYPQISNEYSSYAWKLVEHLLAKGREQFTQRVKEEIDYLVFNLGDQDEKTAKKACQRINKVVKEIYSSYDFIKNLHKEQFSESVFWEKQLKTFQYKVLGELRKEYAASLTFLKEEREELIEHKEENMKENYEDFIQFLHINHHLNLLDPTKIYYPQFHYQYEKYAWEILRVYKNSRDFSSETEKIIETLYEDVGSDLKGNHYFIRFRIEDMKKQLDKMNR